LTARSDEEAKLVALQNGAHDFLTKPFSSLELQTRVANLLRAAKLEEDLRRSNQDLSQALKTLRETEAQLIQSEKINALGTLAAGLLHEILNPLNFTLAAVQMALMNATPGQGDLHETLTDIENGMKRIRDIVGDLRTFAHPEVHLKAAPFRIRDALSAARRFTASELANCRLVEDVPDSAVVSGSESQIVQLLVNLFTNAARATSGRKDGEVRVSAAQSNGTITVRVRDNGVGIAPDRLGKVFDPFHTTQDPGQGMGLGLTICQTIARNHGGKIQIESMQGDWTEVIVELPSTGNTGEPHAHTAGLS
jgi:signal transduction histidine kinase